MFFVAFLLLFALAGRACAESGVDPYMTRYGHPGMDCPSRDRGENQLDVGSSVLQLIGALKIFKDPREQILIGITAGHAENNAAHTHSYLRSNLQELQSNAFR